MLHLRLIVPADRVDLVVEHLMATPGVAHIIRPAGSAIRPTGEVILCDVARESANDLVEQLQDHGIHRDGAIVIDAPQAVVSDAAEQAEMAAAGQGGDALVWEELEAKCREDSTVTASYLVFMAIAAAIAAIGVLLDSTILVIGAMVVGPDYGPLAAMCVGVVRRRPGDTLRAARTLGVGLAAAVIGALAVTALSRLLTIAPGTYDITERQLTAFIANPDGLAVLVAVLAGVVGMLALTESRSGALVGVLVSVTTIPAVGNIGAAAAYGAWDEIGGAVLQLAINIAGLIVAGVVTLAVQARTTVRSG